MRLCLSFILPVLAVALVVAGAPHAQAQQGKSGQPASKMSGGGQSVAVVQKEIEQILHQTDAAANRKDAKGALFHLAEGYQGTTDSGKLRDKKEAEASTKKLFAFVQSPHARTDVQKVSLVNGQAIVLNTSKDEYDILETKSKKPHHFVSEASWRSTWIREKGNWRLWRSQKLSGTVMMDGKLMRKIPNTAAPKAPVAGH